MRRPYLLLLWMTMALAGCYPDEFEKASWGPEPELTLSSPGVTLQPVGGSESVTITTNYEEWTASVAETGQAWCSVEQSGTTLKVTAAPNPDEKERTTVISVTVGKGKKEIKEIAVTQLGTAPRIVADPPAVGLPMEGGTASVKITTNLTEWTPTVAVGAGWCSVVRDGDQLKVSAVKYSGKQQQEGLITVSGEGESGKAVTTVKVIQMGSDPVLNVSEPGAFGAAAGRQVLVVMTNQPDWEATVPSTASWCHAEKSGSNLTLQVDANEGETGRRCELLLTAGSGSGMLKQSITVVQMGKTAELILSADKVTFDGEESIQSISVFTEETWTATTEAAWCTLLPGDQTLTMYAARNTSTTEVRRGTVKIETGSLQQTLEIIQLPDITLALSADTLRVGLEGGTESVTVVTNQTAKKVVLPDTVGWCRASIEGNQLTVVVDANAGASRQVELTVLAGAEGAQKSIPLLVCQEGIASDRDVLIAFYKATGGDNWTHNDNWCSERPLSEWYGVTTAMIEPGTKAGEAVERVTELRLDVSHTAEGNNLVGTLPDVIGQLSELKLFSVGFNQLSGRIPASLGNLTKLTYLELYGNPFTGSLPPEIGNLTKLTFFRVGNTELEGSIPDSFRNLINLETFTVQGCGLTGEFPQWIVNCTNLKSINLAWNALSGSLPARMDNITGLAYVDLRYNQLSGNIPSELGKLVELRELFLENNQFSGSIPKELGNLTNLIWLDLTNNRLSGPIPAELGNMTQLKYLYLDGNQLSGSIPPELGNLTNLITLRLQNNNLTGEIPAELGKLVNLDADDWGKGLQLSGNQLTGRVPDEVQALPNWDRFNPEVNILPQQNGGNLSLEPEAKSEYTITLRLRGDAAEVDQSVAGRHLYGVQVMSRPRGTSETYVPYGYGIYDDSTALKLVLPADQEFNILTTLISEGKTAVQTAGDGWARPLDLVDWQPAVKGVTPLPDYDPDLPTSGINVFVRDNLHWLGHIDRGATTLAADGKTYDRPDLARYAGERLKYVPTADEELVIAITRVSFVVTCVVDSLKEGRIRIEIQGAPNLYVDAKADEHTVSAAITFANLYGGWTDVTYEETLDVKFVWEKTNGLERELSSERVTFKHNTATRLHTVFKDDGMNMDTENKPLTDGEIVNIEGIIW